MNILYRYLLLFLFLIGISTNQTVLAQQIQGVVTDSLTNEPLPYISIFYEGKGVGAISDIDGNYRVESRTGWNELTFSAVGYITKVVKVIPGETKNLNVKLRPDDVLLQEVVVKPKRERYSRKNNRPWK